MDDEAIKQFAAIKLKELEAELASVPEHLRPRFFLRRQAERMLKVLNMEHVTDMDAAVIAYGLVEASERFIEAAAKRDKGQG